MRPWFVLVALAACHSVPTVAPREVPEMPAAIAPPTCVLEGRDVAFNFVGLLARPAGQIGAFAELHHANRVRMELPPGQPSRVALALETTNLRLHVFIDASAAVLYPRLPSKFGDLVVPLANNHLDWREIRGDQVLVVNGPEPSTYTPVDPEWRDCSYLSLRPQPPFHIHDQLGVRKRKLTPAAGSYLVRTFPDSRGSTVSIRLNGNQALWILEQTGKWARILWEGSAIAVVGWLDLHDEPDPGLGHGSGTGSAVRTAKPCAALPIDCDDDLPLFTATNGRMTEIGALKRDASLSLRETSGDYTTIELCDPDVTFASPIAAKTRDLSRCHASTSP